MSEFRLREMRERAGMSVEECSGSDRACPRKVVRAIEGDFHELVSWYLAVKPGNVGEAYAFDEEVEANWPRSKP